MRVIILDMENEAINAKYQISGIYKTNYKYYLESNYTIYLAYRDITVSARDSFDSGSNDKYYDDIYKDYDS